MSPAPNTLIADNDTKMLVFSNENRYLLANFVTSFGTGAFLTVQAIFVLRFLTISPQDFGLILSVGAILGLIGGVILGKWSDGRNLQRLMPSLWLLQAIAVAAYLFSFSTIVLTFVVGLAAVVARGSAAVRGPFMAALVGGARLVTYRAKVRTVANAAMACGAAFGGIALGTNSIQKIVTMMALVPVTYLIGALVTTTVRLPFTNTCQQTPDSSQDLAQDTDSRPVTQNPRFLIVVALNAILMAHIPLLGVAFPLWISERTSAPTYLISAVLLINTIGVVLLQIPVSTFVKTPRDASMACVGAGVALASASIFIAYSTTFHGGLQVTTLIIAALLHLIGEVWHSAASWELAFALAPRNRLGEYQGAFNAGTDISQMLGPGLFGILVATPSLVGWWVLAIALLLAGALMLVTVPWALHYGKNTVTS